MNQHVLPRSKPDPIPDINAVPEYLADVRLSELYADTKLRLGVPWMGVVTMAFAHFPQFWSTLWYGLRPLVETEEFAVACKRLRNVVEAGAREMPMPDLPAQLQRIGYDGAEIGEIKGLINVFSEGNMPYLLIATIARLLLEGHELSQSETVTQRRFVKARAPQPGLTLMEPHHADPATKRVFTDIRQSLGLPFVNTDYRALARWPSYFALAWGELKPLVGSVDHMASIEMVHREAVTLALALPDPGRLRVETVRRMADRDAKLGDVDQVVRLFQWVLPELVVNVACLRAQLSE